MLICSSVQETTWTSNLKSLTKPIYGCEITTFPDVLCEHLCKSVDADTYVSHTAGNEYRGMDMNSTLAYIPLDTHKLPKLYNENNFKLTQGQAGRRIAILPKFSLADVLYDNETNEWIGLVYYGYSDMLPELLVMLQHADPLMYKIIQAGEPFGDFNSKETLDEGIGVEFYWQRSSRKSVLPSQLVECQFLFDSDVAVSYGSSILGIVIFGFDDAIRFASNGQCKAPAWQVDR